MHNRSVTDRLHRSQAGQWVRLPDDIPGSVTAIKDELRGEFVAYYAPDTASNTYGIIEIDNAVQLPTGTPAIAESPIYVADIHGIGTNLSENDPVRAIRNVGVDTYSSTAVNWECNLDGANEGQNPTVNVQLYNNTKGRSDSPVNVKLLEDDLTDAGLTEVACYDPHGEFSAGLADDAVGRATLVRDADTGATRLEFTHLKGPAAWICATLDEDMGATTSGEATATVNSYHGLDWSNEDPADGSGDVTVLPCSGMHENLQSGDKVVAVLKDPDTDPIEYLIVEAAGVPSTVLLAKVTGAVSARSSDTYPSTSCSLGHLVSGVWTEVLTGQTVYNPSLSTINVDYATVHIPVAQTNGSWVFLNAMDLHQVDGWITANDQSIGHDASTTSILWQTDGDCD